MAEKMQKSEREKMGAKRFGRKDVAEKMSK
jgi:hypothetical protein